MENLAEKGSLYPEFTTNLENLRTKYLDSPDSFISQDVFDSKEALKAYLTFFSEETINEVIDNFINPSSELNSDSLNHYMKEFLYTPVENYIKCFFPSKKLLAYIFFGESFTKEDMEKEDVTLALQELKQSFDFEGEIDSQVEDFVDLSKDVLFNKRCTLEERKSAVVQLAKVLKEQTIEFSLDFIQTKFS